ncbi:hypothetical protein KC19_6G017500 [Ceratodon purpureus]|uniref:NAD(P)-binding domain-containing protein n=1 Tax=Ceratodon purpureus TaxID=3225 RepID=A0A8T0HDA0_CERPU|nr:hypothetical protein KC19_6G017500 [Ceratodon purpureus]
MAAMAASSVVASIASASSLLHPHQSFTSRVDAPSTGLSSMRCFRTDQLHHLTASIGTQLHRPCSSGRQVQCTYSDYSNSPDYRSSPIDVVAEVKSQKILVLGGNGFVGTAICKLAVAQGISVVSLSRSGRPSILESWVDQVTWISGDVFLTEWDSLLDGVQAVISTLGLIGPNDQMERINADANIIAVNAAKNAGVPKFIYISVHDYNLPEFALNNGYFAGKRKAEAEILSAFPSTGTILRPGFIYGKRRFNGVDIPLDIVGEPLEKVLAATASLTRPLQNLPASDLLFAPPTSVDEVALAAVRALNDDEYFGIFTIEQIKDMAKV